VTFRRLRRGASPAEAANDHIHDLLRARSGSNRGTVIALWAATLALGLVGMTLSNTPPVLTLLTLVLTVVMIAGVSVLRLVEVRRERREPAP
jgi:hypothetical protein